MTMIGLIVARSKNNVIGKNGKIPWKIKGEQKQFRELTTNKAVIMGRKSYNEIGHPLPNRLNIIGYSLYKEALPIVDKMYITEIDIEVSNGDVFFPQFNIDNFELSIGETFGNDIKYTRTLYTRKRWIPNCVAKNMLESSG